jgi:protein-glutamine gamma-glutamyltransferase
MSVAVGFSPFANAMTPARLGWSAAIVIGASLLHWPLLPPWIPLLLVGAIAWRIVAALRGWRRPNALVRIVLAFTAFIAVLMQFRTFTGLEAGSALLVVMVALKFMESRSQRDQLVLMIISYFLVFASLLYDRGMLTIAWLFAFVFATTVGLLQLGRQGPLLPIYPTASLAGRMVLQAAPIMLVLFMLFPRLPGPLWGMPTQAAAARSGLSDTMSPGDLSELGLSDEVAFRVEFTGREPSQGEMYWRGPVLRNFNGRTWSRSPDLREASADNLALSGEPLEYRVLLEPQRRNWVFALEMPASWSMAEQIRMDRDLHLRLLSFARTGPRLDYRVVSYPRFRTLDALSAFDLEAYRRLPQGSSPRTRALVDVWLAEDATPRAIVARALTLFREQPFHYTLTPALLSTQPVDEFLFATREGFCEHYASAFAVMMRAGGIPARVVTGYHGGERNPLGGYYIVRQSDAHAWTEVWLEDEGWVRVDPTAAVAPERIEFGSPRSALAAEGSGIGMIGSLRFRYQLELLRDAADRYWNQWVMGYGPELQRALLEAAGLGRLRAVQLALLAGLAAILCLLALSVALALRARRLPPVDPAAQAFSRFCRRLAQLDVHPPVPGEAPSGLAQRAIAALPHATGSIHRIVNAYHAARYEPDPEGIALERLRRSVEDFLALSARPEHARA